MWRERRSSAAGRGSSHTHSSGGWRRPSWRAWRSGECTMLGETLPSGRAAGVAVGCVLASSGVEMLKSCAAGVTAGCLRMAVARTASWLWALMAP